MTSHLQALIDFYPKLKAKYARCDIYNYAYVFGEDVEHVFEWVRDHLNTRCIQAEETIVEDPWYTYLYAKEVIRGRWYDEEHTILSDPRSAYYYSRDVIGDQWDEAEKIISTSPIWYPLFCSIKPTFHLLPKPLRSSGWKPLYDTELVPKDGHTLKPYRYRYRGKCNNGCHYCEGYYNGVGKIIKHIIEILKNDPSRVDSCVDDAILMLSSECAYRYARDVEGGRCKAAEDALLANVERTKGSWMSECKHDRSIDYVCKYARDVIKGRWHEAEEIILTSPRYAKDYVRDAIKGRWEEAERVIASDPSSAFYYSRDTIKGRWSVAEKIIVSSPGWAYSYACDVIKGRWPQAERFILKSCDSSYHYAKYVIKGRWPQAEPTIQRDPFFYRQYVNEWRSWSS